MSRRLNIVKRVLFHSNSYVNIVGKRNQYMFDGFYLYEEIYLFATAKYCHPYYQQAIGTVDLIV